MLKAVLLHPNTRKEDVLKAVISWFPAELVQQAYPLIRDCLTADHLGNLFIVLGKRDTRGYGTAEAVKKMLLENPAMTKQIGLQIMIEEDGELLKLAFDKYRLELDASDLLALYESVNKNHYKANILKPEIVGHPNFSKALKIKVACEDWDINSRASAVGALLNDINDQERLEIIKANLNNAKIIETIVAGPKITDFETLVLLVTCGNEGAPVLGKIFSQLDAAKIDFIVSQKKTSPQVLEKLGFHDAIKPESLAKILANSSVIPKSKKIVDVPEHDEEVTYEDTDGYGNPTGSHTSTETVAERSHQEYGLADVNKALTYLKDKNIGYLRETMLALEKLNKELADTLRSNLL
jgi:hypothetical protein